MEQKKIRSSKSTGLADTPARHLKDGSDAIARPLTVLMSRSIAKGSIPSDWKIYIPVYKSDSKTDPTNYRPISVLPFFSKILERAVHKDGLYIFTATQPSLYLPVWLLQPTLRQHVPG